MGTGARASVPPSPGRAGDRAGVRSYAGVVEERRAERGGSPRSFPAVLVIATWLVAGFGAVLVKLRADGRRSLFSEAGEPWDATPLLLVVLIAAGAVTAIVLAAFWASSGD